MGFFDKAKGFFGGKNMATVSIPTIERQPVAHATFPVGDSVLKGTMLVTANQNCEILATKYEVYLRVVEDGSADDHYLAGDFDPNPNAGDSDDESCLVLPVAMTPDQVIEQGFIVTDLDIPKVLAEQGLSDIDAAIAQPNVSLVVKCIADVKGSPFDPSAEVEIRIVA